MQFDFYSDPAHGWLKVPLSLLEDLGISEEISSYSYMRGEHAYLEEDCDALVFIEAMESRGKTVSFREHSTNRRSKIRNYYPFRCALNLNETFLYQYYAKFIGGG